MHKITVWWMSFPGVGWMGVALKSPVGSGKLAYVTYVCNLYIDSYGLSDTLGEPK